MRIGLVLAKTPSYSETFFNSKIKGIMDNGHDVILFVQEQDLDFKSCKVFVSYKMPKNNVFRFFKSVIILVGLIPYTPRVLRFIELEKQSGRPFLLCLKHIIINAHMLRYRLDWLHFGFATMALQSENVAKAVGAKMAVSCRGYDICIYPLSHLKCYELLWKRVDKVHVISNDLLELAYKDGLPIEKSVKKITPAININLFNPILSEEQLNDNIRITTIARLHWKKGLEDILQALAILKGKGIPFHYQIIGSGKEYEPLRFAVHQLNLEDCVSFSGQLSRDNIVEALNNTDIYLQYSISEGFCNAALEAQAMGCLCIVSDAEGLPENVLNNKTGWVVPKRQPKLLANKIMEVIDMSPDIKETVRNNARKRVLEEFNLELQKQQFQNFYKY